MEHWDHNTCLGLQAIGFGPALLMSGLAASMFVLCGIAVGLI
jgi:hypothetical protein